MTGVEVVRSACLLAAVMAVVLSCRDNQQPAATHPGPPAAGGFDDAALPPAAAEQQAQAADYVVYAGWYADNETAAAARLELDAQGFSNGTILHHGGEWLVMLDSFDNLAEATERKDLLKQFAPNAFIVRHPRVQAESGDPDPAGSALQATGRILPGTEDPATAGVRNQPGQPDSDWYELGPDALEEICNFKRKELVALQQIEQRLRRELIPAAAREFTGSFPDREAAEAELYRASVRGVGPLMIMDTPQGMTLSFDYASLDSPELAELREDIADLQRAMADAQEDLARLD